MAVSALVKPHHSRITILYLPHDFLVSEKLQDVLSELILLLWGILVFIWCQLLVIAHLYLSSYTVELEEA